MAHVWFGSGEFLTHLSEIPFLVQQEFVVVVCDDGGTEAPWPVESTSIGVASTDSVCAAERDDLTVVETHATEDGAQM